jgi:hypothetical protein
MGQLYLGATFIGAMLVATPAAAQDTVPLRLAYDITTGGFPLLHFDYSVRATGTSYHVDFTARAEGMLKWLSGFTVTGASDGQLDGNHIAPKAYTSLSQGRAEQRRTQLTYQPDGRIAANVTPPPGQGEEGPVTPIPPDSVPGTMDPLAGAFALSRLTAAGSECAGTFRIFDGRRRYDFVLHHAGFDLMPPEHGHGFVGTAERCTAQMVRIGGYPIDKAKAQPPQPATIWLARVLPDMPPVLIEFAFDGNWGVLRGHLVEVRHGEVMRAAGP